MTTRFALLVALSIVLSGCAASDQSFYRRVLNSKGTTPPSGSATAPEPESDLVPVPQGKATNGTDASAQPPLGGAATKSKAPFDFSTALRPEIILGPLQNCTASNATTTLLVLEPGGFIPAKDYVKLATAVQEAAKDKVRLVVGIVDIDWFALNPLLMTGNASLRPLAVLGIDRVLRQTEKWLPAVPIMANQTKESARREDMILAGHSAMGVYIINAALEQAGGLILLGSMMVPKFSNMFPTASTWTRPVLNLDGELDGQQLPSRQAFAAIEAADNAARLGLNHVAANQPVILIPGMSHQQFGGGTERLILPGQQPADLQPDVSYTAATNAAAGVMANFLIAHRANGSSYTGQRRKATLALQRRVVQTSAIIGPLVKASGRGDIQRLMTSLQRDPDTPQPRASRAAGLIPWAFGGEVAPSTNGKWLAHPGESAVAEKFAVKMQRKILRRLPAGVRRNVTVVATVHTDAIPFLYTQPTLETIPGGRVILRCHVYLWRHYLETSARVQAAIEPEYALKMSTASIVAQALGNEAEAKRQLTPCVDPAAINGRILRDALKAVPKATQERYKRRGKKWVTDKRSVEDPVQWVLEEHVTFTDTSAKTTKVSAPYFCDQGPGKAAEKLPDSASGNGRYVGAIYIKVLSPARAIEWIMIDALRPKQLLPRPQLTVAPPMM